MSPDPEQFVPKVHPASRPVEPEDPMTLHATPVSGDPAVMLRCVVQEYAWMGWDSEAILRLFHDPGYPALNALLGFYGEPSLREQIETCLAKTGVLRVKCTIEEEPASESEPEVHEISIPANLPSRSKGTNHAHGL